MNNLDGDLQQFQTEGINPQLFEFGRQYNPTKPIEQVVCQGMHLEPVSIHEFGVTADRVKIKSTLGLLDEVLHLAAATVELDDLIRLRFHCGNDKGIHVDDLICRLFNFEDNSSRN